MRFIHKWAFACASQLAATLNENHQKRSVYYYGFQFLIAALFKGALLISISLLLGVLLPTLLIAITFASLRMIAGGYHMDTYGKCILVSLGLFILSGVIAQYTYTYWNTISIFILIFMAFSIGLYVLIKYAPKDTPNKPITDPMEIKKFKTLSVVYLFVWLGITVTLAVLKFYLLDIALCLGVLLELFAISLIGHRFFDMIKDGLNPDKKYK